MAYLCEDIQKIIVEYMPKEIFIFSKCLNNHIFDSPFDRYFLSKEKAISEIEKSFKMDEQLLRDLELGNKVKYNVVNGREKGYIQLRKVVLE